MMKLSLFRSGVASFPARWWEGSEKGPWPACLANEVSVGTTWQDLRRLGKPGRAPAWEVKVTVPSSWASRQLCGRG